jgi:hypothetical protein
MFRSLLFILTSLLTVFARSPKDFSKHVSPFKVDLGGDVPRMLNLIESTKLPEKPEYPGVGSSFGVDLGVLKHLQDGWLHGYSWQDDEDYINGYKKHDKSIL